MNPDLWTFTRYSGQGSETAVSTPVFDANAGLIYDDERESITSGLTLTQAACRLEAHWNDLRMRPRTTNYSGQLLLRDVYPGVLLTLCGNELESFSISTTDLDVIIEISINGGIINRAFNTSADTLDLRWRVGSSDSIFICNGEEITAGGVVHGSVLWWAAFGDAACVIDRAYLVDTPMTDDQLRGMT